MTQPDAHKLIMDLSQEIIDQAKRAEAAEQRVGDLERLVRWAVLTDSEGWEEARCDMPEDLLKVLDSVPNRPVYMGGGVEIGLEPPVHEAINEATS